MNLLLIALFLGIVEGLTEFLPVSSTGHLILAAEAIGFTGDRAETFEIFIQLGAILAVVVLYWQRLVALVIPKPAPSFSGVRGMMVLGAAALPVFVLGFLLRKTIKAYLFSPLTVACALIFGGFIMILLERIKGNKPLVRAPITSLDDLTLRQAFGIGLFQCFALWPGMSRSASTIIGGLFMGLDRKLAAEFSFLVAVPVMWVAVTYDLLKSYQTLQRSDLSFFSVGFLVSFLVALIAIKGFISLLGRFTLEPFGWYRIVIGIVVLVLL